MEVYVQFANSRMMEVKNYEVLQPKGLGVCADVEVVGRYTYYVIKIGKTEGASATVGG